MSNLRLAYAIEFLAALIATFTVWSQVGGQGHLDMMAWYWKLLLGTGVAAATVKATVAAVENEQTWNPRTLRWLAVIITLAIGCGVVTYYYHLYEPDEEEEETVTQSSSIRGPSNCWNPTFSGRASVRLPGEPG
jgi:hypothetical protein